jgi:hypothetical protein
MLVRGLLGWTGWEEGMQGCDIGLSIDRCLSAFLHETGHNGRHSGAYGYRLHNVRDAMR